MHKTQIQYDSESKRYFFVIMNEQGTELFRSGEWNTEKECKDGITGFTTLMQNGKIYTNKKEIYDKNGYSCYYNYISDKTEIWGRGPLRRSTPECNEQDAALKEILCGEQNEGNIEYIPLDPASIDFLYSLDGAGYKEPEKNPTQEKQWEIAWETRSGKKSPDGTVEIRQFELWRNETIREKFTKEYFKNLPGLPNSSDQGKEET